MTNHLRDLWLHLQASDLLDILVVAALIYIVLVWLRPRISPAARAAILALVGLNFVAEALDMYLTLFLLRGGLILLLVTLVVVFQSDIRRVFGRVSAWPKLSGDHTHKPGEATLDALTEAAGLFAEEKIGALIIIVGRESLDDHLRGGIPLEGKLSIPLLHSIFHPLTQAHDGAVVLEQDVVKRFGVHLPLSDNQSQIGRHGTRHAAALGLSECCDALALVVSEEEGTISLAHGGELIKVESGAPLAKKLREFQAQTRLDLGDEGGSSIGAHLALMALSLLLACGGWMLWAQRVETVQRVFHDVPVEYRDVPKNWSVVDSDTANVRITLTGSERAFDAFDPAGLVISIDLSDITEGEQTIPITADMLRLPADLSVRRVDTQTITLTAHEMVNVRLPVRPQLEGKLPAPLDLANVSLLPEHVKVILPRVDAASQREILTERIDLSKIEEDTLLSVRLLMPHYGQLAPGQKAMATVRVDVAQPKPPASP